MYVGRQSRGAPPGATGEWGNPFAMQNASDAERDRVIRQYQVWLTAQLLLVQKARQELRGKRLACWCAPKPCHGDVLARIANASQEEEEKQQQQQQQQQQLPQPTKLTATVNSYQEEWPSLHDASEKNN